MSWLRRLVTRVAAAADRRIDAVRYGLSDRFGRTRETGILPYRWYGTPAQIAVRGRVLRYNGLRPGAEGDHWWNNLLNSYRRFNSDEVPFARVQAQFGSQTVELQADDEGYFRGVLQPAAAIDSTTLWHSVPLTLLAPEAGVATHAPVLIPPSGARFAVVSDIDDTVLQTFATDYLKVLRLTLLANASMRLSFRGVAPFYRALQHGAANAPAHNPIFYVSSSPWNLYDLLTDFMTHQGLPAGPLCLRDLGLDRDKLITTGHKAHKGAAIEQILHTYPQLPFVLIGDSGQHDPELYSELAYDHPGRIVAIYIRNVSAAARATAIDALAAGPIAAGVPFVLFDETWQAAQHAAALGLIAAAALPAIAQDSTAGGAADAARA